MDIEIGSNLFRNTNGAVAIEGVPQFEVNVKPSTGAILLNIALFDQQGRLVAKVIDSTMAFNERASHVLTKSREQVEITEQDSGTVVLRVAHTAPDRLTVDQGRFWTLKGHQCTITPTACMVDKHTVSQQETDAKGGVASIGG